ncbi:hypothetical protein Asera_23380 [Actinocatenispora sera]|uniref:Uncharacterized protein n=1 Tax=Actinocatenispora sera TaxID=390989 RepID=A0A810KYC1_9ACTN|nr:hypothetical protein Asera_23380 [Actinocatenispora sera]
MRCSSPDTDSMSTSARVSATGSASVSLLKLSTAAPYDAHKASLVAPLPRAGCKG